MMYVNLSELRNWEIFSTEKLAIQWAKEHPTTNYYAVAIPVTEGFNLDKL